jgi:uncharacterized protein (TIGR02271 family)
VKSRDGKHDEHLHPMSELHGYAVKKGYPDPRGWPVRESDGESIGRVVDLLVDTDSMRVRDLVVDRDGDRTAAGGRVLLDVSDVELEKDARQVLAHGNASAASERRLDAEQRLADRTGAREDRTLTRAEEELRIGKREVNREARVGKHVETERVREPVVRRREEVIVERRPVESNSATTPSIGEHEVRIPLMEEEVIVEKRPVVKEELIVSKRIVEEREVVEADVRREKFDIDNPPRR